MDAPEQQRCHEQRCNLADNQKEATANFPPLVLAIVRQQIYRGGYA